MNGPICSVLRRTWLAQSGALRGWRRVQLCALVISPNRRASLCASPRRGYSLNNSLNLARDHSKMEMEMFVLGG